LILSIFGAAFPLACASEDSNSDSPEGGSTHGKASGDPGGTGGGAGCVGPLGAPVDPATLPEGCPGFGGAHCVAAVPDERASHLATCDGGGCCVPDPFIKTGGVYTPKACTAFDGSAGVCLSGCVPEVGKVASILKQDVCEASERCAPCVFSGSPTGACDIK